MHELDQFIKGRIILIIMETHVTDLTRPFISAVELC